MADFGFKILIGWITEMCYPGLFISVAYIQEFCGRHVKPCMINETAQGQ